jgi:MFS family permease
MTRSCARSRPRRRSTIMLRRFRPTRGLWGHADFMRLWSAQTISQFGSQVTLLALPLAAIVVLDASAFEVAALSAAEGAPWLLFSLPVGAWVDRVLRKPILVVADVGRALVLLSVPLAYALDALTIWQLYAVGFAAGVLTVFFDVAYQSYLPSLVERSQLEEGNSKLEVSRSGAQLAGPGVAGALVDLVTAPVAILVDALSFLASAAWLSRIEREERIEARGVERTRLAAEILEGLRFVARDPYLRPSMVYVAAFNFFTNVIFAIFLVYAVRRLDLSPAVIGLVLAIGSLGFLVGAFLAPRVSARLGVGTTMIGAAAVAGLALFLIPLAPPSNALPFLIASGVIVDFAIVLYNVTGISLFQAITPDRLLGRMNASRRFVVWGVLPLGSLAGGALASTIGLRETLFVGAAGASLGFLPLLFSPLRSVERIPDASEAVLERV